MGIPLVLPQNLPVGPSSGGVSNPVIDTSPHYATYDVFVQDASRNLVGLVDAYDRLSMVPRFNAVGSWALTLDANHPMAPYLKTPGYGIVVNRYIQDSTGFVLHSDTPFFAGPMRTKGYQVQSGVATRTFGGFDNLVYIAERDARPQTTYPYDSDVIALAPYAYYTLGDAGPSGSTATDTSGNARNGTYQGGISFGQTTGIDDPDTGILLDGSTGYVQTGHYGVGDGGAWSSFCVHGWFVPTTLSNITTQGAKLAANSNTDSDNLGFKMQINQNGTLTGWAGNGTTPQHVTTTGAVSPGGLYYVVFQYDGANLYLYLNANVSSPNTAALSGTIPDNPSYFMQFGRGVAFGGTNYASAKLFKWAVHSGTLSTAQITNFYDTATSGTTIDETVQDVAESAIWNLVNNNAAAGATSDRQVSGLTMGTNNNNGTTVQYSARYDNLIAKDGTGLLQELARASSPELGFHVTQSGTALTFGVYVPNDLTSNCLFSEGVGNLGDVTYEVDAPDYETEGNYVVVGGAGTGPARTIYEASDASSIGEWGRAEAFVDKRDSSDPNVLATAAMAALAQFQQKVSVSTQLIPQAGMTYGIDFNLGDKVTVVVDGDTITDLVREVQIDLDPASGEVVTIAIGTDGAQAQPSGNPSITGKFFGPVNAATAKHGKQPAKHLKGSHHAKHLRKQTKHQHQTNHTKQKLERRY